MSINTELTQIETAKQSIRDKYQARATEATMVQAQNVALSADLEAAKVEIQRLMAIVPGPVVPVPPAAPTELHVVTIDRNKIVLRWTDNSSNETAFQIETRPTNGTDQPWEPIKTSGVDATQVEILLDAKDWRYDFRAVAIGPVLRDDDGRPYTLNSEPSNVLRDVFIHASSWIAKEPPKDNLAGIDWSRVLQVKDPKDAAAAIVQAEKDKVPVNIEGLDFNGIQIKTEGFTRGLRIRGNGFRNVPGGWFAGHAILMMGGTSNVDIHNNTFTGIGDADIAGGYGNSRNIWIEGNQHTNTKQGIHLVGGGAATDVTIAHGTFIGMQRMAIELQGGGERYRVINCTGRDWRAHSDRDRFFVSMAAVETAYTLIEGCEAIAPADAPLGDPINRMGICYEVAGRNAVLRNCRAIGRWIAATALSGHNDPTKSLVLFEDFYRCGWNEPWGTPHYPGGIYRDGTPAEHITIKGGGYDRACAA